MVNFVGISKEEATIKKYKAVIDKALMKWDLQYKCYKFNDTNKQFEYYLENKSKYNAYIIDADTINNIKELIIKIRFDYDDIISFIIILDFNNKVPDNIFESYDFHAKIIRNKIQAFELLEKNIEFMLNILGQAKQNISFRSCGIFLKIAYSDIYFIEKETNSKNCVIVTKSKHYHINKTIIELQKELGEQFVRTHRSALVNKDNIISCDITNGVILFKNNKECTLLSRSNKRILKQIITEKEEKSTK